MRQADGAVVVRENFQPDARAAREAVAATLQLINARRGVDF